MIRVEVEEYCQHCLDFSPDVTNATRIPSGNDELILGDTVIRCEYRKRCAAIERFLKKQIKDKENT